MPIWKKYHLAQSVEDALGVMKDAAEPSRFIAGGTDLLLDLQQGRHLPVDTLVDVTAVPEMTGLEITDPPASAGFPSRQVLYIGAAVSLKNIIRSTLVAQHAMALVEATALIGGPQVRNTATLGGNVAHALPAADGAIALLALGAVAVVGGSGGRIYRPLIDLYARPGQSTLDPRKEILVGFMLPLIQPGQASAFSRIMRPQGVALPVLNMAAWISRQGDVVQDVRLSLGPAGKIPQRGILVEDGLRGKPLTQASIDSAGDALFESIHFRTSPHRASSEYRQVLSGVLLEEVLLKAWDRTQLV
jgi:xanthine dehydrogenase FAD-binding subunit